MGLRRYFRVSKCWFWGYFWMAPLGPTGPSNAHGASVILPNTHVVDISVIGLRRYPIIICDVFCIFAFVWLRTMAQKTVGIKMEAGKFPLFFVRKSLGRTSLNFAHLGLIKVTKSPTSTPESLLISQIGAPRPPSTPSAYERPCGENAHVANVALVCPPVKPPKSIGTPTQSGRTHPAKYARTGAYAEHARP